LKIDFRIDWGYQYLYSRRHYHPQYIWDGKLECENGTITSTYKLDYPVIWFGPGHCAKETLLPSPKWESRTKRGLSGVRIEADVNEDSIFHIDTISAKISFKASDLIEKGRIEVMVGPKYLGCSVIITKTGYLWFRPTFKKGQTAFEASDLGLPVHDWARMKLAWISPGQSAKWEADVKKTTADYLETIVHIVAMAVPEYSSEKETQVRGVIPFELLCDGKTVLKFKRYFRHHDVYMQLLEDDWKRIQVPSGHHVFKLKNNHAELCVGISRIVLSDSEYNHGQLSVPEWALCGEKVTGKVFAVNGDKLTVKIGEDETNIECIKGWNEFEILSNTPGDLLITSGKDNAKTEIIDCCEEKHPVKVGYDMTVVPHDDDGYMDWLLDYTQRTRLGNYVLFRNGGEHDVEENLLRRWGSYCKNHGIYVSACTDFLNGVLAQAAGEMMNECGLHEYPGKVYAFDPQEPYASDTMKQAAEKYIEFLKIEIDKAHAVCKNTAFGDASGGIRYSFMAGADMVRAETMVGHTMTLLSQARPAAEALGNGRWGVHIAMQHGHQLYHETHIGLYFLSLMQAWIMGAEFIYEEDSLFEMFKEERQTWDDALTKGKRNMTRKFFRFVKTHPRQGKCVRNIAFIEGRYAAPFNGFICGTEQDPDYRVWGLFGNDNPQWGHKQPEKCRQILDVLMPGASTQPLRQKFDKRRFFFSGTPYGDFDCVPIEAETQYLNDYKLMLNLGWNTMIDEDYAKLMSFVENGGVLLTGIAQMSTHIKRDFLENMDDLELIYNGDFENLCGIKVNGKGVNYSGQWNCKNKETMPEPQLSAAPSKNSEEDGEALLADVNLTGAEIVAWDFESGKPMLVRNKVGKGFVYTFTIWAYPGHEKFQKFVAAWVQKLANESLPEVYVEDVSNEIFWTLWEDDGKIIVKMLNTDWSTVGNVKTANVICGENKICVEVKERTLVTVTVESKNAEVNTYSL